jgi:diacylglycerol kinase (ATP)
VNHPEADIPSPEDDPVHSSSPQPPGKRAFRDGKRSRSARASAHQIGKDTWVGIVANRSSGTGRGMHLVKQLVTELRRVGLQAEIASSPETRSGLVAKSANDPNCRCLIAVGGDGTVAALLNEEPRVPVSVLPAGTENLVARHFGLRRDPRNLAHLVAAGKFRPVDLGVAQGRRFLLMVGFGFDGDVVTRHHNGRISASGAVKPTNRMAYVEPILRSSLSYRFPRITVQILDDHAPETLHGTTVFVFNLPRYALGLPFVPRAEDDDGWLDLIIFRKPGPFQALYYLSMVMFGRHLADPSVYHRRVRKISVSSEASIPVQIDGDPGGYVLPSSQNLSRAEDVALADGTHQFRAGTPSRYHSISSNAWQLEVLPSTLDVIDRPSSEPRPRSSSLPTSNFGTADPR